MTADDRVPARLRDAVVREIGHGGEAVVYELTGARALRVYRGAPHGRETLAAFYREIARGKATFAVPEVLEQGDDAGVHYSIDRLIPGRPLHDLMRELSGGERQRALASYTEALFEIATLPCAREQYGEFLRDDDAITAVSWPAYLLARMHACLDESSGWLAADVPALPTVVRELTQRIEAMPPRPRSLVHGDYFPGNVLIDSDLHVSGVIDFGPLTVMGEPWMDAASALIFLEVTRPGYIEPDTEFVQARLVERLGPAIVDAAAVYRAWYAIRFSPYRDDDPNLYAWCVRSLNAFPLR